MIRTTATSALSLLAHEEGYDPIEDRPRANIRATIEAAFGENPRVFLAAAGRDGSRNGVPGRCRVITV